MQFSSSIYTPQNNIFQYFLTMLGQMVHADLVRQNEYLKVENKILRSKLGKKVRTTQQEKLKLIRYGLPVGGSIKKLISIVTYQTFRKWVNTLDDGNLQKNARLGRPRRTSQEIVDIILRMARENLDWGYGRIMGELKKLGIKRSRNTIKRIMIEHGINPAPKRYEDSWDAYLKRTFETLWGCDFFSQEIWTPLGKKVIFVLFLPVRDPRRTKSELTVTEIIATFTVYAKNSVKFLQGPKPDYLPKNKILSDKKFRGIIGKSKKQNVILEAQKYIEHLEQNPHVTYSDIATKFHTNKVRVCRLIQLFQNLPSEIKNFISAQNNPDFNWHFSERKLRELTSIETKNEKIKSFEEMVKIFQS